MKANILLEYQNKWVALNETRDEVLYAANSADSLQKKLEKVKEKKAILHYVTPFDGTLSP